MDESLTMTFHEHYSPEEQAKREESRKKLDELWAGCVNRMPDTFDYQTITGYRLVQTRNGARIVFLFKGFEDMPEMPSDFVLSRRRAHRFGKKMLGARLYPTGVGTPERTVNDKFEVTLEFHWADVRHE